uniref:Uncharacterized protein n=1 Tax=Oreochromis aureus TaxID=47969 RepID=A0A668RUJ7_OREAU
SLLLCRFLSESFGRGNAADCRRHVQKLNTMRGAMMEEQERCLSHLQGAGAAGGAAGGRAADRRTGEPLEQILGHT